MKKKILSEFRNKSGKELDQELSVLAQKKLETEVALAGGKEKNLKALKSIRRNIAQILTLQHIIERQEEQK